MIWIAAYGLGGAAFYAAMWWWEERRSGQPARMPDFGLWPLLLWPAFALMILAFWAWPHGEG